jgi:hypothetical protein
MNIKTYNNELGHIQLSALNKHRLMLFEHGVAVPAQRALTEIAERVLQLVDELDEIVVHFAVECEEERKGV